MAWIAFPKLINLLSEFDISIIHALSGITVKLPSSNVNTVSDLLITKPISVIAVSESNNPITSPIATLFPESTVIVASPTAVTPLASATLLVEYKWFKWFECTQSSE